MKAYLIGYDLNKQGQNYKGLIAAIEKTFLTRWRNLDSTCIVRTDWTAVQIRDFLTQYIDSNDELLVVALSGEAAWIGMSDQVTSWLKNNLPSSNSKYRL